MSKDSLTYKSKYNFTTILHGLYSNIVMILLNLCIVIIHRIMRAIIKIGDVKNPTTLNNCVVYNCMCLASVTNLTLPEKLLAKAFD